LNSDYSDRLLGWRIPIIRIHRPPNAAAIFLTLPASAQDRPAIGDPPTPNAATQPLNLPKVLTGTENLHV
jgi:hypothetical protein